MIGEVENSRKFKEELIKDKNRLARWNMTLIESLGRVSVNGVDILLNDYRQIGQAIIEKIIKPNPQEWKIKKICVFDGDYWSRNVGPSKFGWGYKEWETALIHRDFVVKYDNHGELIIKDNNEGKIHYKSSFTSEEWEEIQNIVSSDSQQGKKIDPKSSSFPTGLVIGVVVLLVAGLITILVVNNRKKS